jgi:hypothetical protein
MPGRALQWVIAVAAAALVTRLVQSAPLPSTDSAFVGGASALAVGLLVAGAAMRVMRLPSVATTGLGITFVLAVWTTIVAVFSLVVGGAVIAVGQRAFCGGDWPSVAHVVNRDLVALFALPTVAILLASGPLQWPTNGDWRDRDTSDGSGSLAANQSSAGLTAFLTMLVTRIASGTALLLELMAHAIRAVVFPLVAGSAVVLFALQVQDFAARWPGVFTCPP